MTRPSSARRRSLWLKLLLAQAAIALALALAVLWAYDRLVTQPLRLAQRIGLVDVQAIVKAQEMEYARLMGAGSSVQDHERAALLASQLSERLPPALDELPQDCQCLVVLKGMVVGRPAHSVDLTSYLQTKLARP